MQVENSCPDFKVYNIPFFMHWAMTFHVSLNSSVLCLSNTRYLSEGHKYKQNARHILILPFEALPGYVWM